MWRARAGQARRVASMLSPRDAALVEAYARECDDSARASSIEGARVDTRRSVDIQCRDDRSFGRQPKVVSQIKPHEFADSPKRAAQFFCPSGTNSVVKQMVPASRTQ